MREVKFRVWDHAENRMREDISIPLLYEAYKNDVALTLNDVFSRPLGVEIMQYTGLKDSKDVEIYEGDVVKFIIDSKEEVSEVFFDEGGFSVNAKNTDPDYTPYLGVVNSVEVIGNIHKNPDLLGTPAPN